MLTRLVVAGRHDRFVAWLATLVEADRRRVKEVRTLSDMFGVYMASVEFMPDWRDGRTDTECRRLMVEARIIEGRRSPAERGGQ